MLEGKPGEPAVKNHLAPNFPPRRAAMAAGMLSAASTHARTSSSVVSESSVGVAGADTVEDAEEPMFASGCVGVGKGVVGTFLPHF